MQRNNDDRETELVEFGTVVAETKGTGQRLSDSIGLPQVGAGLTDD